MEQHLNFRFGILQPSRLNAEFQVISYSSLISCIFYPLSSFFSSLCDNFRLHSSFVYTSPEHSLCYSLAFTTFYLAGNTTTCISTFPLSQFFVTFSLFFFHPLVFSLPLPSFSIIYLIFNAYQL